MGMKTKFISIVLVLAVMIIILVAIFGPGKVWETTKKNVLGVKQVLPDVGIGLEELEGGQVTISAQETQVVDKLKEAIEKLKGENCLVNYGGLPELQQDSMKLRFETSGSKMKLTVFGGAGGKQIFSTDEFENKKPCVIASGNVAENFYDKFIDGDNINSGYFKSVSKINIAYYDKWNYLEGNIITVPEFGKSGPVNDEGDNIEDGGWLFTPDGVHVCFFPTNKERDYDDDGIENDIVQNEIPSKIARCSG